ncbi:MAG: sugar phosphate isomerase/epimerase [Trueperaceae bacterium]|nr:MAG: sugar phosphate isomerase/epimerase [Trueperaceae bacterium]
MNYGVNTWVWISPTTTERFAEYVPKVRAMGFDMIEFGLEDPEALDYRRAAEILKAHDCGISVAAAMGPDRDLIKDDEAVQRNALDYLRHCIDACHTLGATNLVGPMYSAVGRVWKETPESRERDVETLVTYLKTLSAYAFDRGVVLCLEPLNRFETSFINLARQVNEIVDRVDHPACKVLLDTFHMNIEEKSLGDAIRATGQRLGHFHACENDRGAPGSGNVTWGEVAQALRDIDYRGPVVIESFTSEVTSIARAAAVWRPFEASQDALAQQGLAFLKELLG